MNLFRRKATASTKADALAVARKAVADARREQKKRERRRAGKQSDPAHEMTVDQWIGGGGV